MTATTVMGVMPPWLLEMLTAMGVVTDLGSREAVRAPSSPKSLHISSTLPMEARLPIIHPTRMGSQQRRSAAPCLQFPHIQYLSVNKQRGPPPGEPRCTGRFNYSAGVSSAGVSSAGASVFSAGAPSSAGVFS